MPVRFRVPARAWAARRVSSPVPRLFHACQRTLLSCEQMAQVIRCTRRAEQRRRKGALRNRHLLCLRPAADGQHHIVPPLLPQGVSRSIAYPCAHSHCRSSYTMVIGCRSSRCTPSAVHGPPAGSPRSSARPFRRCSPCRTPPAGQRSSPGASRRDSDTPCSCALRGRMRERPLADIRADRGRDAPVQAAARPAACRDLYPHRPGAPPAVPARPDMPAAVLKPYFPIFSPKKTEPAAFAGSGFSLTRQERR